MKCGPSLPACARCSHLLCFFTIFSCFAGGGSIIQQRRPACSSWLALQPNLRTPQLYSTTWLLSALPCRGHFAVHDSCTPNLQDFGPGSQRDETPSQLSTHPENEISLNRRLSAQSVRVPSWNFLAAIASKRRAKNVPSTAHLKASTIGN